MYHPHDTGSLTFNWLCAPSISHENDLCALDLAVRGLDLVVRGLDLAYLANGV